MESNHKLNCVDVILQHNFSCASAHFPLRPQPQPCAFPSSRHKTFHRAPSFLANWMRLMTWIKGLQNILSDGRERKKISTEISGWDLCFQILLLAWIRLEKKFCIKNDREAWHSKTPIFCFRRIDEAASGECEPCVREGIEPDKSFRLLHRLEATFRWVIYCQSICNQIVGKTHVIEWIWTWFANLFVQDHSLRSFKCWFDYSLKLVNISQSV